MTHTTKYGNTYTDKEWAEMQAYFKQEKENDQAIGAKIAGLENYLKRVLREEGLDARQIQVVVSLFKRFDWEEANIKFTSQSRQAKLNDLWLRWNAAMDKVYDEAISQGDKLENVRLKIMESDGM